MLPFFFYSALSVFACKTDQSTNAIWRAWTEWRIVEKWTDNFSISFLCISERNLGSVSPFLERIEFWFGQVLYLNFQPIIISIYLNYAIYSVGHMVLGTRHTCAHMPRNRQTVHSHTYRTGQNHFSHERFFCSLSESIIYLSNKDNHQRDCRPWMVKSDKTKVECDEYRETNGRNSNENVYVV